MGWYFTNGATRRDIIADLTREHRWTDGKGRTRRTTTLRHCARGNVLWALVESDPGDGTPLVRLVACYLLQNGGDGWGYKPMDETVGPFYYTCPLAYLDAATAPLNETAARWRADVRAKAAEGAATRAAAKGLKPGDAVVLVHGCTPRLLKLHTTRPLQARGPDGRLYRIPRKLIDAKATALANGKKSA